MLSSHILDRKCSKLLTMNLSCSNFQKHEIPFYAIVEVHVVMISLCED